MLVLRVYFAWVKHSFAEIKAKEKLTLSVKYPVACLASRATYPKVLKSMQPPGQMTSL